MHLQGLPPCPWPSPKGPRLGSHLPRSRGSANGAAVFALCYGLRACSTPFRAFVTGLQRRDFARPPVELPKDFVASQLRGGLDLTPTGLSPASLVQLGWTHTPLSLFSPPFAQESRRTCSPYLIAPPARRFWNFGPCTLRRAPGFRLFSHTHYPAGRRGHRSERRARPLPDLSSISVPLGARIRHPPDCRTDAGRAPWRDAFRRRDALNARGPGKTADNAALPSLSF